MRFPSSASQCVCRHVAMSQRGVENRRGSLPLSGIERRLPDLAGRAAMSLIQSPGVPIVNFNPLEIAQLTELCRAKLVASPPALAGQTLAQVAPYFTNQIEIITHIAKSIPVGYKVFVRDHPIMDVKGGRNIKFYKEIMKLPNVQLFHPSLSQDELIMKCSLVVTVAGTGGMEAAIYGKPSIILTDTLYSSLPSVTKLQNLEDLPNVIRAALQKKVNPADMKDFIDSIDKHSFQVDKQSVVSELRMRFYQKKIQEKEMITFLDDFRPELEIFSSEYIKKIKMLSNQKNQTER